MKKKLAFVDYWHHQHTRSNDFLRNELSKEFQITEFWWSKSSKIPLNELKKFDYIFFFQVMLPYRLIKKIGTKKIFWAPMYDGLNFRNFFFEWIFWKQIFDNNIRVISFSNKISEKCMKFSIDFLQLRYFMKPQISFHNINYPYSILFWDRGDLKIEDWLDIFDPRDVKKIYYIDTPDPGKNTKGIKRDLLDKYDIEIIKRKFRENRNEFLQYLKKSDIFITPRKKEGIGLPAIEAISYGKYIIGYDDSTLNEYLVDSKIGKLFKDNKVKIDHKDILDSNNYRLEYARKKFLSWEKEKNLINSFIFKETKVNKLNLLVKLSFLIDDLKNFIKSILNR